MYWKSSSDRSVFNVKSSVLPSGKTRASPPNDTVVSILDRSYSSLTQDSGKAMITAAVTVMKAALKR